MTFISDKPNKAGIDAMRQELPGDAREHFDAFVIRALTHDYVKQPRIWDSVRLSGKAADRRILILRANSDTWPGNISIHSRVYMGGEYGVLIANPDAIPKDEKEQFLAGPDVAKYVETLARKTKT